MVRRISARITSRIEAQQLNADNIQRILELDESGLTAIELPVKRMGSIHYTRLPERYIDVALSRANYLGLEEIKKVEDSYTSGPTYVLRILHIVSPPS